MSSTDEVTIGFSLTDEIDADYLIADLSSIGKEPARINLNDENTCQESLKSLFLIIAEAMTDKKVSVVYSEPESYPRPFINDAMRAYIKDLQLEISSLEISMGKELGSTGK